MSGAEKTSAKDFEAMGLTPPEKKLWKALEAGEECVFDENAPERERNLRGDILGAILRRDAIEGVAPLAALPRHIIIDHAVITSILDMTDTQIDGVLFIVHSRFNASPNFSRSTFALLNFLGSEFKNGAFFDDVITKSHIWLDEAKCYGEVTFFRALIGGQFSANDSQFSNDNGRALSAQGARIKDGVFLRGAKVTGELLFMGVEIGFQFDAENAHFLNPSGNAINAQSAKFNAGIFLRQAMITGCVDFNGSQIESHFVINGACFSNPDGIAINLQGAEIKDTTWLTEFAHPPLGKLHFTNAQLGRVIIDENSYPLGSLYLNGARYSAIDDRSNDDTIATLDGWLRPKSRDLRACYPPMQDYLKALPENESLSYQELAEKTHKEIHRLWEQSKTPERHPFAYRQFARVLKANGHEAQARAVRIEAEHEVTRRNKGNRSVWWSLWRVWRFTIKHLVAYGIKPWRVLKGVLFWWFFGAVIFWLGTHSMTPAKELFYMSDRFKASDGGYVEISPDVTLPKGYPKYSPIMYSLDVMLPVVDFAQESHWRPKNTQGFNWLRNFNRIFLALGWALSTIAVLGFTGVIADRPIED